MGDATNRAAYVGDVTSDLLAAEHVGVLPIGAAWAASSPLRGIEPQEGWLIFDQVKDLPGGFRRLKIKSAQQMHLALLAML